MKLLFTLMVTYFWTIGVTFMYVATQYHDLSNECIFAFLTGVTSMGLGAIVFSLGIIIFLLQDKLK